MKIRKIYSVEVSGACNLEATCSWCPMHNRPRYRKRGLMSASTVDKALEVVARLAKPQVLFLHGFGEPLLHPEFDTIALRFSELAPISMSTNGVLLDEAWADRLAKIPWGHITVSPWDLQKMARATKLLSERGVPIIHTQGVTHSFAGQAKGPTWKIFPRCAFFDEQMASIRWDGTLATCCISDRDEDALGSIFELELPELREYSICSSCHHGRG